MSVIQYFELHFWNFIILLLQESALMRALFRRIYRFSLKRLLKTWLLPAALYALAGLSLGFSIGVVATYW